AQDAIASLDDPGGDLPDGVEPFRLESFGGTPANEDNATLELVRDVQLDLRIELGRTQMSLEDVLRLQREAVVALDKLAGDPVDVYANGRLIARGEVLVLNDNFCVRVTELIVGDSAVA
ncbi:MAG: flagellar motor switch protein FliN, partial [Planctomycetota bacterium]